MAPTKPFFQEILDALAAQPTPELALVLDLSQAVGAEQRKTATPLVRRLVAEVAPRERPVRDVSPAFFYELMARLLMLGWFEEFQLVIAWYRRDVSLRSTTEGLVVESWENLLDRIPAPRPALSSEEVKAAWAAFVRGLEGVLRTLSDVKRPKPVRRTYSGLEEPQRGFGTVGGIAPTMIEILETGVEQLVGALQILFQQMLEPAVLELEARRTSTRLRKLDGLLRTLFGLFESHARSALVALLRVELTRIVYGRVHRYVDAFPPPDKARTMVFDAYDRDAEAEPADKKGWLEDSIRIREKQIRFYLDLYGEPQKPGPVTGALQQRQRLIQGRFGNALRLRSSEDLAEFLAALFEDTFRAKLRDKKTVTEARRVAWNELLALLRTELGALTTPSGFDLTDDPRQTLDYVSRVYPRALNGGELHDCGVYAVRIAFVLLSAVERLRRLSNITLDVRPSFIILPLHVGLLVESADVGPVVAHNETIYGLVDALPVFRTAWTAAALPDDPDPSETAALETKFLEDVTAALFIRDVDMPILRRPVLKPGTPPTAKGLWTAYQAGVVKDYRKLFGRGVEVRGSDQYQFDLRYLEVLGLENRWRNEHVVGLWNKTCRKAWERHEKALNTDFKKARGPYLADIEPGVQAAAKRYVDDVRPKKFELSAELRKDGEILGRGVRAVFAKRLKKRSHNIGPVGELLQHIDEVKRDAVPRDLSSRELQKPTFASDAGALVRVATD